MTGGVGLYNDVLVAVNFTHCQDCHHCNVAVKNLAEVFWLKCITYSCLNWFVLTHSLGALSGNVLTPSIAWWKARGRLYIGYNWTFLLYLTVEAFWVETCRGRRFSKRRGSLWARISDGTGRRPPTTVGVRKLEWLPFRVISKYLQCIVWFCHKAHV